MNGPPPTREAKFSELIANHQNQIYGFVRAMVRRTEDAQDLHQQTLVVLWQKFDKFESGTNFLAWALRVAELEVLAFRRRNQPLTGFGDEVFSQLADAMHGQAESGVLGERIAALKQCLTKLSKEDSTLIKDVYVERHRVKSVAEQLGRIPQSVSNSLRRIRRVLFDCIESAVSREGRRS
jgi:RNA polymerase sigma-70 factor (ECF subfamily)